MKTRIVLNPKDPASYHAVLDKCLRRSSSFRMKMEVKTLQAQALQKRMSRKNETKISRDYFVDLRIHLVDHLKVFIPETITVLEFVRILKRVNDKK